MPGSTTKPPSSSSPRGSLVNQSRWTFSSSEDGGVLDDLRSRLLRSQDDAERLWGRKVRGVDPYWEKYKRCRDVFAAFVVTHCHTTEPAAVARPRLRRRRHHDDLRQLYMEGEGFHAEI
ncbi:hypothetical protein VMCG_00081 [Cytospora schulzeri]|uniref:Uncharacterized protein n=1 Tax=Cytospora schulzeri TaxID=448051 RepID=A0A423XA26_9PEZI|nr:hypothetical protein VMCG_00081 [Valsa malicola]